MSDSSQEDHDQPFPMFTSETVPPPVTKGRKRASDGASSSSASKKLRTTTALTVNTPVQDPVAQALVTKVLANVHTYVDQTNPNALGNAVVTLAAYARALEGALTAAGSGSGNVVGPSMKSPESLKAAAEKIRKAAVSGIKKQMSVSQSFIISVMLP